MKRAYSLLPFFFCILVLTAISFSSPNTVFAAILFSSDFGNLSLDGWSSSGGSATASISAEQKRSGNYTLKVLSDKTSSFGYQYSVGGIEAGAFYEITGYGKTDSVNTNSFSLRIAWYKEGSNAQLSSVNESNIVNGVTDWINLTTGVIQAPSLATSAKIRLVLTTKTAGQTAYAFFDDVTFTEAIAPTPTPTSTPTPSSIPTPTRTPTPVKTPTLAPTDKEQITSKVLSATISSNLNAKKMLGTSTKSAFLLLSTAQPTKKPASEVEVKGISTKQSALPYFFIAGGVLLLLSCGILTFRPQIKKLWGKK